MNFGDDSDINSMKLVLDGVVVGPKIISMKDLHALGVCFCEILDLNLILHKSEEKSLIQSEGEVRTHGKHHRSYVSHTIVPNILSHVRIPREIYFLYPYSEKLRISLETIPVCPTAQVESKTKWQVTREDDRLGVR